MKSKKSEISVIYQEANEPAKYFKLKKSKIYFYTVLLPIITVISILITFWSLSQNSPLHYIEKYKQFKATQGQVNSYEDIEKALNLANLENNKLQEEIRKIMESQNSTNNSNTIIETLSTPGLTNLSFFKPIDGQKDLSSQSILNLTGFSTNLENNKLVFNFNIIPKIVSDEKISGFIIVLGKYDNVFHSYPEQITTGTSFLADYTLGESFSTQRFRPVEATFVKPVKAGDYSFKIFIFSKNGDLIHTQQVTMKINLN